MNLEVNRAPVFVATGGREVDPALPTAVFLHGAAMDHTVWALPVRYFVRHGWNALAPDLPGHGRSGGTPLRSVVGMADWLTGVLDAAGVERAAVAGHSLGALVALDLAARYPDRVRSLTLLGVSVPMPVSDDLLAAARDDPPRAFDMITIWALSYGSQLGGYGTPGNWMPGGGRRLLAASAPGALHADLSACNDYDDGLARAATVRSPALLVLGERDQMTPARAARELARTLPGAETLTLPGCGHILMAERPNEVLDALVRGAAAEAEAAEGAPA